jgi:hypothetical protein
MIKFSLVLFSYFSLLLMGAISDEEILVENNTPAMISPGSKSLVEIVVTKGEIQGFSKLELTLPAGFNASPADIKGASFTFSGQKAKFVWMTLPSEESFKVSYYIESAPDAEGPYEISGIFSYVKSNKREDISIPGRTVLVKKGFELAPEIAEMLPALKKEATVIDMICERSIIKISETEYTVTLRVINNKIQGFGKILETLPANCNTEKINDGGAVVTQDENTIKFVWFEVPVAATFEVSYKILCTEPILPVISGLISYTEDGNPITAGVMQVEDFSTPVLANNEATNQNNNTGDQSNNISADQQNNNTDNSDTVTNQVNSNQADTQSNLVDNKTVSKDNNLNNQIAQISGDLKSAKIPVSSIPAPETGVTYKVQILAAHRVVNKTYLKDKYNFNEQFNIENHEGWVKYTTGSFSQYKEARDARVKITSESSKLPGPFVTAYNDGERITVQEALLVSKQLWYK